MILLIMFVVLMLFPVPDRDPVAMLEPMECKSIPIAPHKPTVLPPAKTADILLEGQRTAG
jgi:hypothetical protein